MPVIQQAVFHSTCAGCGKPTGELRSYVIPTAVVGMCGKGSRNGWAVLPPGWLARARTTRSGGVELQGACSVQCAAKLQALEEQLEDGRTLDPRDMGLPHLR